MCTKNDLNDKKEITLPKQGIAVDGNYEIVQDSNAIMEITVPELEIDDKVVFH